jgi:hypothetical protein
MVETPRTVPISSRAPRVFCLFHRIWDSITNSFFRSRGRTSTSRCSHSRSRSCKLDHSYHDPPMLICPQVERGYRMHLSGDYVSTSSEFSSSKWLQTTDLYIDKIKNDLTSENWTAIFQALYRLEETHARDEQIEAGAPTPKAREALLPADPPSPPPLD